MIEALFNAAFVMSLVVAAFWFGHRKFGRSWSISMFLVAIGCTGMMVTSAAAVALLLSIAALVMPKEVRPKMRACVGLAVSVLVFGLCLLPGIAELNQRKKLRVQFPIQSVSERLQYELERSAAAVNAASLPPPNADQQPAETRLSKVRDSNSALLAKPVADRLAQREGSFSEGRYFRRYELNKLHDLNVDEFVIARGFGVLRMRTVREADLKQPHQGAEPVPVFPTLDGESFEVIDDRTVRRESPPAAETAVAPVVASPTSTALIDAHDKGQLEFINSDTVGYVAERQKVAGFESHAFRQTRPTVSSEDDQIQWEIVRLELISLLRFAEPRVYVAKELPQMERLKSFPTRPLDDFENGSLQKLQREEDVVASEEGGRVLMLGSLRAGKHCLDCHSVKRGELLGAFSYELRPRRKPQ